MWAKARDELRRPGFNGGGGGNPFDASAWCGAIAFGRATGATTFFAMASAGGTFSTLPTAFGAALGEAFVTDLGTDFWATVVASFLAGVAAFFEAVFALSVVLTAALAAGLMVAFGASLAEGLTADFLACGLVAGNFLTAAVLPVAFTAFLVDAATAAFAFGLTELAALEV